MLEIGSGWGTLLKVVQDKFGCEVFGVEISELASRLSKDYYGLKNIYNKSFENYFEENKDQKFDFIILIHVLEHFLDPGDVLSKIRRLLSDNGRLYLAVPDITQPDEPLDRFFHFEHCYYFTPLTLKKMLNKSGLKIIYLDLKPGNIHVIAEADSGLSQEIDGDDFGLLYSAECVLSAVKKQDRKYKILRFFKKIFRIILPNKILFLFKKIVIGILKKLKIISI